MTTTTKPMIRLTAKLNGQRLVAGDTYLIRKLTVTERPGFGIATEAIVQDAAGYLYPIKNAHLAFNLNN